MSTPIFLLPSSGENKERRLQYFKYCKFSGTLAKGSPSGHKELEGRQAVFEVTLIPSKGLDYFLSHTGTSWRDIWVPEGRI